MGTSSDAIKAPEALKVPITWREIAAPSRPMESVKVQTTALDPRSAVPKTPVPPRVVVKFSEAVSITVRQVATFQDVPNNGELYHVSSAKHFAMYICGFLVHGNIGTIHEFPGRDAIRLRECKYKGNCVATDCTYYHDPAKCPGSSDIRNFASSSWAYVEPLAPQRKSPSYRRFGSRKHLDTDIVGLTQDEIDRFGEQAMHDILCFVLLKDMYKS
jgi:hypothetical protein